MKQKRRTLVAYGRKNQRVRVLVDANRKRVEVIYAGHDRQRHKKVWPNTKAGRADALLWAETFVRERERVARPAREEITHRELWAKYREAPAYADLRAATRKSYDDRWALWVAAHGQDSDVNHIELEHLDRFITAMRTLPTRFGTPRSINQVRQVVNTARTVFNWGQSRKLVRHNVFVGYRWKQPRDARALEPAEYTPAEYAQLVNGVSPQDGTRWRLYVLLVLGGVHAGRANAIRHLAWADIAEGSVHWNRDYQKTGEAHEQPLTWDMVAALETARYWTGRIPGRDVKRMSASQRTALEALCVSPWVLPGHGDTTKPWGYQAMWRSLMQLEREVGVTHRPYRALHGMRKLAAGTVADSTGDDRLGMEWIGDRDMKQKKAYLKRRRERMSRAADAASVTASVPKVYPNEGAAEPAEAKP